MRVSTSGLTAFLGLFLLLPVLSLSSAATTSGDPVIPGGKVTPHWIGDPGKPSDRFWYRVDLPGGGMQFILVDAGKGLRHPAFDHDRVASEMSRLLGGKIDPNNLPVVALDFRNGKILLRCVEGDWELDPSDDSLKQVSGLPPAEGFLRATAQPVNSSPGGEETEITFVNRTKKEMRIFWVRSGGEREDRGTLAPGTTRTMNSYSGHSWMVGTQKSDPVACFVAGVEPGTAIVADPMVFGGGEGTEAPKGEEGDPGLRPRALSPNGKSEVVLRGDNLFLRETATGHLEKLTSDGNASDSYAVNDEAARSVELGEEGRGEGKGIPEIYWAPDSRHFIAMSHMQGTRRRVTLVQSSPDSQLQPITEKLPYLKPGDEVPKSTPHLFDAVKKNELPVDHALFPNPWVLGEFRWSPDSREFTFLYNQRGHQVLRILGVNAETGSVRTIVEEKSPTFICYSSKYFAGYLDGSHEIVWMSERDGWNHLYLFDAATGRMKNQITSGEWTVRGVDRIDSEKRQIWFRVGGVNPGEDPYNIHHYRINLDGTGLTEITPGEGTHTVTFSPDRRFLVDARSSVDHPPVIELRRSSDGGSVLVLEKGDISALKGEGWRPPEPFVAKARDGKTDIYGIIYTPRDFDPARKYPLIEDIYAGPQDSFVPKSFSVHRRQQELADHGFVVVQIDGMGTSNRSKAFHDVCWKNLGDAGFPDRIAWIRAAAGSRPWMDLGRVGIYGTSAGGQSALRGLLDHGDFYRVGVADSGCHDNRMDKIWWNEQWLGWPVDESYVRSSNVADAHKLTGKLLLMAGELDRNVDPSSTMQVVNALVRADKDFEFLMMPNTGHGVLATPYGKRRLVDFFKRNLLDSDPKQP